MRKQRVECAEPIAGAMALAACHAPAAAASDPAAAVPAPAAPSPAAATARGEPSGWSGRHAARLDLVLAHFQLATQAKVLTFVCRAWAAAVREGAGWHTLCTKYRFPSSSKPWALLSDTQAGRVRNLVARGIAPLAEVAHIARMRRLERAQVTTPAGVAAANALRDMASLTEVDLTLMSTLAHTGALWTLPLPPTVRVLALRFYPSGRGPLSRVSWPHWTGLSSLTWASVEAEPAPADLPAAWPALRHLTLHQPVRRTRRRPPAASLRQWGLLARGSFSLLCLGARGE